MENTEKFRGNTNGIILFILLGGDRHTDELKDIIDEKFASVKIGTLYSIIARMKTQGHIAEYRASSADGSRRKYYKITDLGRSVFDSEFSHLFIGYDLIMVEPEKKEEKLPEPVKEPEPEYVEDDDVYIKYVKKAEMLENEGDIDFSAVKIEEQTDVNFEEETPVEQPIFEVSDDVPQEKEVDYDSVVTSNYEYKSVLNQLFPKSKNNLGGYEQDFNYVQYSPEPTHDTTPIITNSQNTLFEISEKENIKIRTSVDTNRYQGAKILDYKLRFHSAFITSVLAIIEFLLLTLIFSGAVHFSSKAFLVISIIFGVFTVVMGVIYVIKRSHSVKDLPKFINSLEIAIVLTISTIIISICIASIRGVDIYNFAQIFFSIILPAVMAVNIPIYVAVVHFLSKLDFYQAI